MLLILGVLVFLITFYAILKRYQTTAILMIAGIALFAMSYIAGVDYFTVKGFKPTGSSTLDIMAVFTTLLSSRIGEIGLIIMSAGGFAKYMDHIGAADTFVTVTVKPLHIIKNPYILLAMAYIFGQLMNIVVPSAAGLGMLLLVTLYPVLRKLGVSAGAAAAVIVSASCLDLGPASGNANAAAKLAALTPMEYFVSYQLPTSVVTMLIIAVLFYFTSKYFDNQDKKRNIVSNLSIFDDVKSKEEKRAPAIYAILPVLPLAMLLVFSKYVIEAITLDVVTAMFISLFVAMLFELIRNRSLRPVLKDITVFLLAWLIC